jgi:hypothetical protein
MSQERNGGPDSLSGHPRGRRRIDPFKFRTVRQPPTGLLQITGNQGNLDHAQQQKILHRRLDIAPRQSSARSVQTAQPSVCASGVNRSNRKLGQRFRRRSPKLAAFAPQIDAPHRFDR